MKRSTAVVLILCAPLAGCAQPVVAKRKPPPTAEPSIDNRPPVGRSIPGDDLTALAREQNRREPPLPKRRGVASRIGLHPITKRTKDGFVARIPGASRVPTPAHYKGRIYAGGFGTYTIHALNARTGRGDWSLHLSDDGPTEPACVDDVCVFNTFSCTMFGVDAETGKPLWSWYLGSPQLATPVVSGNVVYSSYPERSGPEGAQYVIAAFDLKTGKPGWRRYIDAEVNSTPVVYKDRVYLATRYGTLYELGAKDGEILSVRKNQIASAPVLTAGGVLFSREETQRDNDMLAASRVLFPRLEEGQDHARYIHQRPRPLVADRRMVTIDQSAVIATDKDTGRRLWQRDFGENDKPADVPSPMLFAGNSILLATTSGKVLRIQPDSGDVLTAFELGEGPLASQPIAVDGWLYAGTMSGTMVAFDTGAPELTGWDMLGGGPDRRGTREGEGT
jgi:outer membrane protein assembly factor BamB